MSWIGEERGEVDSLSEAMNMFYSLPGKLQYTDITFLLSDGSKVEAYKFILALSSPVFEMELYEEQLLKRTTNRVILLYDMVVFRNFTSFIYKNKFDLHSVNNFE